MANQSGKAYGLTVLSPIMKWDKENRPVTAKLREKLLSFNDLTLSPMSSVPNTYLARFYILEDVFFEDAPYQLEHLQSKYLVFSTNFYGDLDTYLEGMFGAIRHEIKDIWQDCYGFDANAMTADRFKAYIKKCQVETTFFFDGSTDDTLKEQLKSLYIKQEFSKFVFENAHKNDEEILKAFRFFIENSRPREAYPTWKAGVSNVDDIVGNGPPQTAM